MICIYCSSKVQKKGKRNGIQQYRCNSCKKYFREAYKRRLLDHSVLEKRIPEYNRSSVGVRDMGKILNIAPSTVCSFIRKISGRLFKIREIEDNGIYEVDEMRVMMKNKKTECWIVYALNRVTGRVFDFVIGRRSKETLGKLVAKLLETSPKRIHTDGLNIYRSLIPANIHRVVSRCTNKIERHNLTLRTHLKRLSRRTICFSRSMETLFASVNLYFFH